MIRLFFLILLRSLQIKQLYEAIIDTFTANITGNIARML